MDALESLAARYTGEPKIQRLHYWALNGPPATRSTAWQLLEETLQTQGNTHRYAEWFLQAPPPNVAQASSSNRNHAHVSHGATMQSSHDTFHTSSSATVPPLSPLSSPSSVPPSLYSPTQQQQQQSTSANTATPASRLAWYQEQMKHNQATRQVLWSRWQAAPLHPYGPHKDALRQAGWAWVHFLGQTGEWVEAWPTLMRLRETACTNRLQTTQVSLALLHVAMALHQWNTVREYVHKLEHASSPLASTPTGSTSRDSTVASATGDASMQQQQWLLMTTQVQVAKGLERLMGGDGKAAMEAFVSIACNAAAMTAAAGSIAQATSQTSNTGAATASRTAPPTSPASSSVSSWLIMDSLWMAPEEISTMAALLTLAYGSRADIRALVDDWEALALVPRVRDVLQAWVRAHYARAWDAWLDYVNTWLIGDVFVGPLWASHLQHDMRTQILQAYWSPYHQVSLQTMVQELGPSLAPSTQSLHEHLLQQWHGGSAAAASELEIHPVWHYTQLALMTPDLLAESHDPSMPLQQQHGHSAEPQYMLVRSEHDATTAVDPTIGTTAVATQASARALVEDVYALIVRLGCIEHDLVITAGSGADVWATRRRTTTRNPYEEWDVEEEDEEDDDPVTVVPGGEMPEGDVSPEEDDEEEDGVEVDDNDDDNDAQNQSMEDMTTEAINHPEDNPQMHP
jgi:hypothetical protein